MSVDRIDPTTRAVVVYKPDGPRVKIVAKKHQHFGESGYLDETLYNDQQGMTYLKLSNCEHGKVGCWVKQKDYETMADVARRKYKRRTGNQAVNSRTRMVDVAPPPDKPAPPEVISEQELTIRKLSEAFASGWNVSQACHHAGISRDTYYRWLNEVPGLSDRMDWAQDTLNRLASSAVEKALISGDLPTVRWYKDRRDPDYKPKSDIDNTHAMTETRNKIREFLDDDDSGADDGSTQPAITPTASEGTEVAEAATDIPG